MTVTQWSDSVREMTVDILKAQRTLVDLEYEIWPSMMQINPQMPPIPVLIILVMAKSPIMNEPPIPAQAIIPIGGEVIKDKLETEVRKLVEHLATERSKRLTQSLDILTQDGGSPEKPQSGLILGR